MQETFENLRIGATVWSADGKRLGKIIRLIVDERLERVDAIVVAEPPSSVRDVLKPGPDRTCDRIVPRDQIAQIAPDRVVLRLSAAELERLPEYEREHYVTPDESWTPPPGFLRDHFLLRLSAFLGGGPVVPPLEIDRQRGPDEREIAEGTGVWRVDGVHEKIGEVARVLFDEDAGHIRALVLRRGHLFPEQRILPIQYVVEVLDDVVRVRISPEELARLERFDE